MRNVKLLSLPRLIGLVGYAGVGKDTAAQILVDDFNYVRIGFADPLKEILTTIGWDGDKSDKPSCSCCGMLQGRALLQAAGTEGVRRVLGTNIWTDHLKSVLSDTSKMYVISDVRFNDEALALKDLGAILIRVTRSSQPPALGHASETDVDRISVDAFVPNEASVEELRQNLNEALDRTRGRA